MFSLLGVTSGMTPVSQGPHSMLHWSLTWSERILSSKLWILWGGICCWCTRQCLSMSSSLCLGTGWKAGAGGLPQTTAKQELCQHCVQLVWSERSHWEQASERSQVYLSTSPAILLLHVISAVQQLEEIAAGKLFCHLPCLIRTLSKHWASTWWCVFSSL